jgi:hypothetical protein
MSGDAMSSGGEERERRMQGDDVADEGTTAVEAAHAPFRPTWMLLAVSVLLGLFYAYDVWEGVDRWIQWSGYYRELGLALPWGVYLAMVLAPFALFVAVMVVGRRRSIGPLAIMLVVGLAASAAVALSLQYFGEWLYVGLFGA